MAPLVEVDNIHGCLRSGRAIRPRADRNTCNAAALNVVVSAAVARRTVPSSPTNSDEPQEPHILSDSHSAAGSVVTPQTGHEIALIAGRNQTAELHMFSSPQAVVAQHYERIHTPGIAQSLKH